MQTRQLGKTDMHITPIGVGAWAIGGNKGRLTWGEQDDQASIQAIHRAIDLGINWIDTAAIYGMGHSEEVVGKAVKESREKPYIFTKCSLVWNDKGEVSNNLHPASIRREVEASLKRLGVDVIDLYQIHWPNPDAYIEESWRTLAELQKEGKVRAIGVSNFSVEQMRRIQRIAPIASSQPPYSLLNRDTERDILPFCQQQGIGVIVYSPMESGLLSGMMSKQRIAQLPDDDWRKQARDFQEPQLSRNLALANLLTEIGYPHGVPAGVVAIAWTLRHPAVTGAIVGFRNPLQVEELVPAAEFRLKESELEQIEKFFQTAV
jgi:aryl-alcohol dehydrogenase-like predicted oxidoreductase